MRRIEALSGPAAIDWFREREAQLREVGELLGSPQDPLAGARRAAERLREAGRGREQEWERLLGEEAERFAGAAAEVGGIEVVSLTSPARRPEAAARPGKPGPVELGGETAIVLGRRRGTSKVGVVVLVSKAAVARGSRRRESSAGRRESSAGAAEAATRWLRPAAGTPESSGRHLLRRAG